ncbi:MAG TPA: FAD:protein FMN transferase [Planctomycetaceae bacterium]|jgi:thiamine biosynthesis lipoprotein|nr:FAD:protein FMN transferase [Planctomycetaceae bacterium]
MERLEYRQVLMGVPVRILVYAHDREAANAAMHTAFDRIRQLNLIFSDYDEDSEISRLTRNYTPGQAVPVSVELATVLAASLEVSRQSEGAFDVTVGPLVRLWRASRRTKRLPSANDLAAAKQRVGYKAVHLDLKRRVVTFDKPGMQLDFGGIVKGYAADEARAVLKSHGLKQTLVGLSGDISVGDPPPGEPGWKIGVAGTELPEEEPKDFVWLTNRAVSTAGDAFQFVEIDGKRYSHLVDPKTGLGITRRVSVTVIAPTGLLSDGLDSAAAILGPEKGIKLLQSAPGVSARYIEITKEGPRTFETGDFARYRVARPPSQTP